VPDRTSYIIRENAKRKDDTDGFTTFTVSGYFGSLVTAPNATNPIPSVLGANVGSCNLTVYIGSGFEGIVGSATTDYNLQILGDTLTRKFTMRKTDSVTTLALPSATLSATILLATITSRSGEGTRYSQSELENKFSRSDQDPNNPAIVTTYKRGSLINGLISNPEIISVNRSSFGEYDEVTVTWGLKYNDFQLSFIEERGPGWVRPTGIVQGGRIYRR
jgi:hypothetical protein